MILRALFSKTSRCKGFEAGVPAQIGEQYTMQMKDCPDLPYNIGCPVGSWFEGPTLI